MLERNVGEVLPDKMAAQPVKQKYPNIISYWLIILFRSVPCLISVTEPQFYLWLYVDARL
jgi:hypothetical protein